MLMSDSEIRLTKSNYTAGLQCEKRLYLEKHHRELRDEPSEEDFLRLEEGTRVGKLARQLFPGGVTIESEAWEQDEAEELTRQAMGEGAPAIFEAGLGFGSFIARVDILKRGEKEGWDLLEVKSSLVPEQGRPLKEEHIQDVAFQWWVAKNAGVKVNRAGLVLLRRDYIYPGGEYNPEDVFEIVDLTGEVKAKEAEVAERAYEAMRILQGDQPEVPIGPHCTQPYTCPFFGLCHQGRPQDHIWSLPRLNKVYPELVRLGVERIPDISEEEIRLDTLQQRVVRAVKNGEPYISRDGLRHALENLEYPVHFMDFETVRPALPLFEGTKPFQELPFQWSLHVLHPEGALEHLEYLHEERTDPRRSFCEKLRTALRDRGTIVIYSSYEIRQLRALADWDPDLAGDLAKALDNRGYDLLKVVKDHLYLPEFGGSFSLKAVAPALLGENAYGDLEIQEGGTASARYLRFLWGEEAGDDLFLSLRAYCSKDTEVLVHIFYKLWEFAGLRPPS